MSAMSACFERLNTVFPVDVSACFRYGLFALLGCFVVVKLFSLESALEHQQQLLSKQSAFMSQQQALMKEQLNRLENNIAACEQAVKAQQTVSEDIKACRGELETMKAALHQIQTQTEANTLVSVFKQAHPVSINSTHPASKLQQTATKPTADLRVNHQLPFQVLNIDIWNGEAMVRINYQDHVELLSKQDTLAGWTVAALDFDKGWVTFKKGRNRVFKSVLGA